MGLLKKTIKPMFARNKWNILRGDTVKVLTGKDKNQVGTVVKVIRDTRKPRVVVSGINLQKRHIKRREGTPGGIISVEGPIHYSNVALIDPKTKAAVRVSRRFLEDGTKVRISRGKLASGNVIPRPEILKERRTPRPLEGGKDTSRTVADAVTYKPDQDWPSFTLGKKKANFRQYSTIASSLSNTDQILIIRALPCQRRPTLFARTCGFAALTAFDQ